MWQILGYILFIVGFVSLSRASMSWPASAQKYYNGFWEWLFWIAFFSLLCNTPPYGPYGGFVFGISCLLVFSFFLSGLFNRPFRRRRIIPPRVRVKGFTRCLWLIIVTFLALTLLILLSPERFFKWVTHIPAIPFSLLLVSIGGFFIKMLCEPTEICANGLWYEGGLHEWNNYDSFFWRLKDNKIAVDLVFSKDLRTIFHPSKPIVVPPENWEAVKKLLEANLINSTPEEARARRT